MKLPNGDQAIITIEKIRGYCLNVAHPSGRHKAKVFASALGITADNAEDLKALVARAAIEGQIAQQSKTAFGQIIKVDWPVPEQDQVILRTLWEITLDNPLPRLVSAFIK